MAAAFHFTKWRLVNLCVHLVVLGGCMVLFSTGHGSGPLVLLLIGCLLTGSASIGEAWYCGGKGKPVPEEEFPQMLDTAQ